MGGSVSAAYVRILISGAQRAKIALDDVLTDELRQQVRDPDGRVDRSVSNRLWEELSRRSADDAFGLSMAQHLERGAFAVMDYAARSAPDLRQAMLRFVRYCRLVYDPAHAYLTEEGPEARLGYTLPGLPRGSPRHAAEFIVASWVCVARQMTQMQMPLRRVRFEHPRPASSAAHARLFGCEVLFGQDANEITLESQLLETPVVNADPTLSILIDRYADELLKRLPKDEPLTDRVRGVLSGAMRGGDVTVEVIAAQLAVSPRSLQRKLQESGTTFQELLDGLRQELALRYLDDPTLSIGEVAFLLGFSEASAFHRAFRRWTGTTPGEHRRRGR